MHLIGLVALLAVTGCRNKDTVPDTGTWGTSELVDLDSDGSPADEDCDDGNGAVYPGNSETPYNGLDDDCDDSTPDDDLDGDGHGVADDCDDADATVHPDATESCNDVDDDCNGLVDDSVGDTWYADADQDGYGDPAVSVQSCDEHTGFVSDATDCDDTDDAVNPGADEVCNGLDDDCDGLVDDDDDDLLDAGTWYHDGDGDGFGDELLTTVSCDAPSGWVAQAGDCEDDDAAVNPDAGEVCNGWDDDCDGRVDADDDSVTGLSTWWLDVDGDGIGGDSYSQEDCEAPEGFSGTDGDCDDSDASVVPGATETCNDGDDDCDTAIDEDATDAGTWYYDVDGDGYGDADSTVAACDSDGNTVADATDCDDGNADVNPGAAEACNGIDDDCDGLDDDDDPDVTDSASWYDDDDGDGFGDPDASTQACSAPAGTVADDTDCDDGDATAYPGAPEVCDGDDEDCDGLVDDDDPDLTRATTWYLDHDGDGTGDPDFSVTACDAPTGYLDDDTDCDDTRADVLPGAPETCDGADNDCDATVDEDAVDTITIYTDADGDGFGDPATGATACEAASGESPDASDCDDGDATVNPDAEEVCDGIDNDCDGDADSDATDAGTWYDDDDGDGYGDPDDPNSACTQPTGTVADDQDCDDSDATLNPDTVWFDDADGDGHGDASAATTGCEAPSGTVADDTDCDDADSSVHPGATELCDFLDQDCDATVDEGLADTDSSGVADCKEVAVLVTVGFQDGGGGYECEGMTSLERELVELEAHLGDLGLTPAFFYDDSSSGVAWADVGHLGLLLYHNGGWSAEGSSTILDTLNSARAAGMPLLFMGDDLGKHANNNESTHGDRTIFELAAIQSYESNGDSGHDVVVEDSGHAVMDGDHGVVGDFWYSNDLDELTLAGVGEEVLMASDTSGEPAVWVWEDGSDLTAVLEVSVYESHACPISDAAGLAEIEVLFKNAVTWLRDG